MDSGSGKIGTTVYVNEHVHVDVDGFSYSMIRGKRKLFSYPLSISEVYNRKHVISYC